MTEIIDKEQCKWIAWTEEQCQVWEEFKLSLPSYLQELIQRYDLQLDYLYRIKETGQLAIIHAFYDNGTISLKIEKKFNPTMVFPGKVVHNYLPDDIELAVCELEREKCPKFLERDDKKV